ncbi:MAG: DUF3795 domain-containing protein [Anaerolineales bacterium]|jgi:hypothetical protein
MNEMIAYCGLKCHQCPALLAMKTDDDALRAETAATWSKEFGEPFKAEDINCVGCLEEKGVHIGHCAVCDIRQCGKAKGVANCGFCEDYACEKLSKFFGMVPEAKVTLDGLKAAS